MERAMDMAATGSAPEACVTIGGVKHYGPVNGMLERLFEAGRASRAEGASHASQTRQARQARRFSRVRLLRLEQGTIQVLDVRPLPGPHPNSAPDAAPGAARADARAAVYPNSAVTSCIVSGMAIPWGQRVSHTPQAVQAPARALSGNVM